MAFPVKMHNFYLFLKFNIIVEKKTENGNSLHNIAPENVKFCTQPAIVH